MRAFERLLALSLALTDAGRAGVSATRLMEVGEYGPATEASRRKLQRDLDDLRATGLHIENKAEPGIEGRYVIVPGDTRLRLEFTPGQRAEIARAAAARGHGEPVEIVSGTAVEVEKVLRAVQARCLMHFTYNGKRRAVDPALLDRGGNDLVVVGFDRDAGISKTFVINRMTALAIDQPGTARVDPRETRPGTDPITWRVDPPVTATLSCDEALAPDVCALLGGTYSEGVVTAEVTNRMVFLARVIELRTAIRLLGPPDLREELRVHLLAVAGAG